MEDSQCFYCDNIGTFLNFSYDSLEHCCMAINAKGRPVICKFEGGNFPFEMYLSSYTNYTLQNISQKSSCFGCINLKKGQAPSKFEYFKTITFNHFTTCNLSCIYCKVGRAGWRNKVITNPYNVIPALFDLYNKEFIRQDTILSWGGGEPVLYKYFVDVLKFCAERDIKQHINTNGVVFSQAIADVLSKKLASVSISIDCGMPETFIKVKGADCFDKVCANIERYNRINPIGLKYVITPTNSAKEDIDGFLNLCTGANISHITISPELHLYNSPEVYELTADNIECLRKQCLDAARELYMGAIDNNVTANLLYWDEEDTREIIK